MGTHDNFLDLFQYDLNELKGEKKTEFDDCTSFMDENSPEFIDSFYGKVYHGKVAMANKIMLICLNTICRLNVPVHIINMKFRTLILDYVKLRSKIVSFTESISMKADDNLQLLALQVRQFTKFVNAPADDEWKKDIEGDVLKVGYDKGFIKFFLGMFMYKMYCIC